MKRQIKFRAWDKHRKNMIYSNENQTVWGGGLEPSVNTIIGKLNGEFELMQFTGLTDKNGVEIYEGDVVDCKMFYENTSLPHRGIIEYNDKFGCFATRNQSGQTMLIHHDLSTLNVIGNVYENDFKYLLQ